MSLYLDSSVIVPCYCQEPYTIKVQETLTSLITAPYISSLTLVEIHSAFAKKIRRKELPLSEAASISKRFGAHLNKGLYKKFSLQKKHYIQAKTWLKQFHINSNLRTLDALQLSAAAYANLPIFTLDKNLANAAKLFEIPYKFLSE